MWAFLTASDNNATENSIKIKNILFLKSPTVSESVRRVNNHI